MVHLMMLATRVNYWSTFEVGDILKLDQFHWSKNLSVCPVGCDIFYYVGKKLSLA